jgi:hypothetical protein
MRCRKCGKRRSKVSCTRQATSGSCFHPCWSSSATWSRLPCLLRCHPPLRCLCLCLCPNLRRRRRTCRQDYSCSLLCNSSRTSISTSNTNNSFRSISSRKEMMENTKEKIMRISPIMVCFPTLEQGRGSCTQAVVQLSINLILLIILIIMTISSRSSSCHWDRCRR